jgi:hypothetical protein
MLGLRNFQLSGELGSTLCNKSMRFLMGERNVYSILEIVKFFNTNFSKCFYEILYLNNERFFSIL